jgi:uncharacterized protein YodC (DUF2158 family)
MEYEFKDGDAVRLRSGGPDMTIKQIGIFGMGGTTKEALCTWFDGKKLCEQVFALATLVPARQAATASLQCG